MTSPANQPLRIAYVVHTFDVGGLERCVARLVNHLDTERFSPLVICLNRSGDAAGWIQRADVPVIELGKRQGNDLRVIWRLAKALRDHRVDVVHSHNWGTLLETTLARRRAGVPAHVHAEHGLELADLQIASWRKRLRGCVARWALARADAVVAVADGVRRRLASRFGHPADAVELIGNGVDAMRNGDSPAQRDRIRRSLGVSKDTPVIGSVGRLAPVKDFGTAIEAISMMVGRGRNVHLVVVGSGPELDRLTAKTKAAAVDANVHFVGQQDNVGDWLAAMDLYVNSSLNEGMSLSILEAMSAGLPSVVTDVGENAALVGGNPCCGLIAPPQDAKRLAGALEELLDDRDARRRCGACARERFEQLYSTKHMVTRYENLYTTISSRRQKDRLGQRRITAR